MKKTLVGFIIGFSAAALVSHAETNVQARSRFAAVHDKLVAGTATQDERDKALAFLLRQNLATYGLR
jgi:hypothetical protein